MTGITDRTCDYDNCRRVIHRWGSGGTDLLERHFRLSLPKGEGRVRVSLSVASRQNPSPQSSPLFARGEANKRYLTCEL
jgi:hypothetical protein